MTSATTSAIFSSADPWLEEDEGRRKVSLNYLAFPKQREFHQCRAKYRLFGGAAGPGKSKALLMEAIAQALETPGGNTLLLRRTFPELENSLLLYFRRDVPREFYRSFNEAKHTVTWRNGSTTRFGYSQSEHDIYQYQSGEYLFIGIDELTHFTLRQWQFLTSRNRCPIPRSRPGMAGATNPGNIGHAWVKALFIDKQPAPGMDPREYDPADYAFVAARVADNPIYAGDSSYLKSLQRLPDFYRRAFLDGDWSVFAGQYFSNFDPSRSVVRAESLALQPWTPRWISIDWGFEHPAAAYWHAAPPAAQFCGSHLVAANFIAAGASHSPETQRHRPAESQTHEPGTGPSANNLAIPAAGDAASPSSAPPRAAPPAWDAAAPSAPLPASVSRVATATYRELVAQHLSPRALAAEIIARSRNRDGKLERIGAIYLSPDAFACRTGESSIAEQMGDVFAAARLPRPAPADNDRVGGWMLMYQMLDSGEWRIADSCPELIRTLPELVRDSVNVEDIAKRDGDDAADAARYGLKSHVSARMGKPPREQEIFSRASSGDPTIRAIQMKKAECDLRSAASSVILRPGAPARRASKFNFHRRWFP